MKHMKKILIAVVALVMCFSLVACSSNDNSAVSSNPTESASTSTESNTPSNATPGISEPPISSEEENKGEAGVCTPEAFDEAVAALNITTGFDKMPTYADVVELFGVDGAEYTEMEYEGYCYYTWTDGKRNVIVTFQDTGDNPTYYAISGDIM